MISDEGVAGFQEALRADYPHLSKEVDTEIQVDGQGQSVGLRQKVPVWRLSDADGEDRNWQVSITVNWVALEVLAYSSFEEYKSRLGRVLAVLERTVSPSKSKRVGLRKVNHFKHPSVRKPSDWARLLNPGLLGLTGDPVLPVEIAESFNVAEFEGDEHVRLRVMHGVPGAPDDHLKYVLDSDCYSEQPFAIAPGSVLLDALQDFSETITGFFHWALTDELREYLSPKPRTEAT